MNYVHFIFLLTTVLSSVPTEEIEREFIRQLTYIIRSQSLCSIEALFILTRLTDQ